MPSRWAEKVNKIEIPNELRAKIESLSGISLKDVKVYYNSTIPAKHKALAFTKGTKVFIGLGQEEHLAHELLHVVQQLQNRVKETKKENGESIKSVQEEENTLMNLCHLINYCRDSNEQVLEEVALGEKSLEEAYANFVG